MPYKVKFRLAAGPPLARHSGWFFIPFPLLFFSFRRHRYACGNSASGVLCLFISVRVVFRNLIAPPPLVIIRPASKISPGLVRHRRPPVRGIPTRDTSPSTRRACLFADDHREPFPGFRRTGSAHFRPVRTTKRNVPKTHRRRSSLR